MSDNDNVEAPAVWSGPLFWYEAEDEYDDDFYPYEHHIDCDCDDCFNLWFFP